MKSHGHRFAGLLTRTPRNARRFASIFNPPSPPPPLPPLAPPPILDEDNPELAEARRKRRLADARRRGRAATVLTGGDGDPRSAGTYRPGLRSRLGGE